MCSKRIARPRSLSDNSRMEFMSGWSWFCKAHDSFGQGETESEIQFLANAHITFFAKENTKCEIFLKNHDLIPKKLLTIETVKVKSNYMARVKETFERAWQKWSEEEDALLRQRFDERMDLPSLTQLHHRAEGGIVARLKKLGLLEEQLSVSDAREALDRRHSKLINAKKFSTSLRVSSSPSSPRTERGKESFSEYGTVNPPPVDLPDLKHTSLFTCASCGAPVIGNSCLCRNL